MTTPSSPGGALSTPTSSCRKPIASRCEQRETLSEIVSSLREEYNVKQIPNVQSPRAQRKDRESQLGEMNTMRSTCAMDPSSCGTQQQQTHAHCLMNSRTFGQRYPLLRRLTSKLLFCTLGLSIWSASESGGRARSWRSRHCLVLQSLVLRITTRIGSIGPVETKIENAWIRRSPSGRSEVLEKARRSQPEDRTP